jgi:hypothetical protein
MKKKTAMAFGRKKVYLLGKDLDGTMYWLEAPSWDCDWYWGFGYVETYTYNSRPDKAHDILSHQHIDSAFMGKIGENSEYIYNICDAPLLKGGTTFTEKEGWELSELFKQYYTLEDAARLFYFKNGNISSTTVKHDSKECKRMYDYINQTMMPAIFKRIDEILSPETEK